MEAKTPERNNGVMKVGRFEVDLDRMEPLTVGDRKRLFKDHGVNLARMHEMTPEGESNFILYTLKKIEPKVEMEDVESMPSTFGQAVMNHLGTVTAKVDIPFGLRSTPSGGTTGGDRSKSAD